MHELSIMTGVMEAVETAARDAGATRVTRIVLRVGEMTEAIDEALQFAFEVLSENTLCNQGELTIERVAPKSICLDCGNEFSHDRFHRFCPQCESYSTHLIEGRELEIESIEVDFPDEQTYP